MTGLNHFIERKEVVSLSFRGSDSSELGQFTFRDSGKVDMVVENEDFFPEIKPITDLKKDYKLLGRQAISHNFPNNSNLSTLLRLGSGGFSSVYLVEVVLFIHFL